MRRLLIKKPPPQKSKTSKAQIPNNKHHLPHQISKPSPTAADAETVDVGIQPSKLRRNEDAANHLKRALLRRTRKSHGRPPAPKASLRAANQRRNPVDALLPKKDLAARALEEH